MDTVTYFNPTNQNQRIDLKWRVRKHYYEIRYFEGDTAKGFPNFMWRALEDVAALVMENAQKNGWVAE